MGVFDQMQQDAGAGGAPVSLIDQMRADAKAQLLAGGPAPNPAVKAPTSGFLMGLRDPIDAGAQLLENMVPKGVAEKVNQLNNWLAEKGLTTAVGPGGVTQQVKDVNADYDSRRRQEAQTLTGLITGKQPEPGFDWARLAGNVLNPANAAVATRLPGAITTVGRVGVGVLGGAAGGALQPVTEGDSFWTTKGEQTGIGAAAGGILTPALGKVVDKASAAISSFMANRSGAIDLQTLNSTLRQIATDAGQRWEDMSPTIQGQLREQTLASLKGAGQASPAAVARQADFAAEGMQPTLGQVTRDAGQFAKERNLRTLPGVGDPLLQRFMEQGRQMQGKVGAYATGADEAYPAGKQLADALTAYDAKKSGAVTAAYQAARNAAGKDAEVPLQGLAQDYAGVLDAFGDKVPSGVRNQFAKFGLDPSTVTNQRKIFTVEEADKLLKVINSNQSNDPAVNAALSQLRSSVKGAVTADAGVEDVFSPARKAAAERFALHDAVPALQAASTGSTAPDDFVRRFVIQGKTAEVQKLAQLLKEDAPEAVTQARAQIGAVLQRAAYGENVAGDKAFSPERYAKALRSMGDDKLGAFFTADEVSQLHRLSRIGSYIDSVPNASPVQSSNNWGAIMNVASHIPGVGAATKLINGAKNVIDNQSGVTAALGAKLPQKAPEMTPDQVRMLARLLSITGAGGGAAAAQQIPQ